MYMTATTVSGIQSKERHPLFLFTKRIYLISHIAHGCKMYYPNYCRSPPSISLAWLFVFVVGDGAAAIAIAIAGVVVAIVLGAAFWSRCVSICSSRLESVVLVLHRYP
jgi:hypothetical protein